MLNFIGANLDRICIGFVSGISDRSCKVSMVCLDEPLLKVNILCGRLSHQKCNASLGFMAESLRELLKAFVYAKQTIESPMAMQPNHNSQRSLMNVIGTDLTQHVLEFVPSECLPSTFYVCKFFNRFLFKTINQSVLAEVNNLELQLSASHGYLIIDWEIDSLPWDLVSRFSLDINYPDDLMLLKLIERCRQIKTLKELKINAYRQEWVYFFSQVSTSSLSLRSLSLRLRNCQVAAGIEHFRGIFSALRLESFSIDLWVSTEGLNENILCALPSTITSLFISLPQDNQPIDFSLLLKLDLKTLALSGGSAEFVPEVEFGSFLQVASNVCSLLLKKVIFPEISSQYDNGKSLHCKVKFLSFIKIGSSNSIQVLKLFGAQLESLEFEPPTSNCYEVLRTWTSTSFPMLRELEVWSLSPINERKTKTFLEELLSSLLQNLPSLTRVQLGNNLLKAKWPPESITSQFNFARNLSNVICKFSRHLEGEHGVSSKKRRLMIHQ
jgi:hypothetical protein